jgi:hypothetical protein
MKIYPIGTVFQLEEQEYMIAGYQQEEVDDRYLGCYLMIPYPIGFVGEKEIISWPMVLTDNILWEGYAGDQKGKDFLQEQNVLNKSLSKVSVKEVNKSIDTIAEKMRKEAAERSSS